MKIIFASMKKITYEGHFAGIPRIKGLSKKIKKDLLKV